MKIVAGMHRSGTSIVARLLSEAGADFGDPATFYPADEWNPDGYFEQREIHSVNMPLINGPFWKFSYFWLPSPETIVRRSRRFADEISRLSGTYADKFVKENRFCLTLGAWLEQGAEVEKVIVCLREPYEVARSVQRRNRTTLRRGYTLWHAHHHRLQESAEGIPQHFVLYRDLIRPETFAQEATGLLRFAGLPCDDATISHLRGFMRAPKDVANPEVDQNYPDNVRTLWDELVRCHSAQRVAADRAPARAQSAK